MSKILSFLLVALMVAPAAVEAQVYPERVRSVTRVEEVHVARSYQRGQSREEQTERTTRTLRLGPNGELIVGNISGDVTITRTSGADVTVEVVKTGQGRTADDAREMLKLVEVEVVERGGRGEVRARYPSQESVGRERRRNLNVSVAFTIAVPERTRVAVNSISGSISVRDVKGELALETISGNVRIGNSGRISKAKTISGNVEIAETQIEGAMDASTVSGTLTLRKVKAARLDLGSVSGDIFVQDVSCERVHAQSISGEVEFSGQLARGGRYELSSHSGQVHLTLAGDVGFEVEASSFSGSVRTDIPLTVQGSTEGRRRGGQRSLRGTHGDGSAVLDLSTFSGSIVIAKR